MSPMKTPISSRTGHTVCKLRGLHVQRPTLVCPVARQKNQVESLTFDRKKDVRWGHGVKGTRTRKTTIKMTNFTGSSHYNFTICHKDSCSFDITLKCLFYLHNLLETMAKLQLFTFYVMKVFFFFLF